MREGTLQQLVANRVVVAIRAREHVLVSPGQCDALRRELEGVIAPSLDSAAQMTFSRIEGIADRITEQIHTSDHIEDIYAADGAIRRDALAAVRQTLLGFMRGELPLVAPQPGGMRIDLDELGDMARFVTRALDVEPLEALLQEAAARTGATLAALSADEHCAVFTFADEPAGGAIALEEAIVERLLRWVEADRIELPAIEQLLSLSSGGLDVPAVTSAIERACERVRHRTGCVARCEVLDGTTLRVRLIPLTENSAERLDEHYDDLLDALQQALAQRQDGDVEATPRSAPASKPYPAEEKRSQRRAVRRHGRDTSAPTGKRRGAARSRRRG